MTLSEIIERLEKATGPNYAIELAIKTAFEPDRVGIPSYTASVDAAIALANRVLPRRSVMMGWRQTSETRPWARVGLWPDPDATGATPAIALCLASLRALSKQGDRT